MLRNSAVNELPTPPVHLILAGWGFSNDQEKKQRWDDTLMYALEHSYTHLSERLGDESFCFAQLSESP